ncbi:MAG: peptidoglycan binding domain-containing protein [Anaerolineae bacterium]|jgi:lipoprotein-anchoring transpeptidase ErfK/SrfK
MRSTIQIRTFLLIIFAASLLLALAATGLFSGWVILSIAQSAYGDCIYPNVYVLNADLGGLTPDEAATRLTETFRDYETGALILSDGERQWRVPWPELGLHPNVDATIQGAFAVGRADQSAWILPRLWLGRREVAPVFVIDPESARAALERLAPEMAVLPTNATLRLEGSQLVAVPGRPGRALDVDATLAKLTTIANHVGSDGQLALAFESVPPNISDASPAQTQAEQMLANGIELSTYDLLTDETFTWTLARETLASWLRVEQTEDGTGLTLRGDEEAVRETVADLAAELGEGRGFRLDEATEQVLHTFETGGGTVQLYLTHPTRTYTVQGGDRLNTIAAQFGMPAGLIAEANPDVDLNWLHIGQQLTIPSQDVLTPHIPVRGKRIVISTGEQRMRVYEEGELLYDWPVSTGISSSPTYTGIFQILSKEENAYAGQWDLWMPHFLAIYRAGGDVYNGIHALPILSSGQRLWGGLLGSPASYGCIILGIQEGETLYQWADVGVVVVVE